MELRGLLRMLDDVGGSVSPPPVLDDLPELARTVRANGATVDLRVDPGGRALAEGLQVATYRIVQEALTNVLRHAGAVPVRVVVECTARGLEVEVLNGTAPDSAHPPALQGTGRGIAGMTARAAVYGGELTAGPTPDGGFAVRTILPAGSS